MKKKLLLSLLFTLFISTLYASHFRGGKINWTRIPGTRTVTFSTYAIWESASFIGSMYFNTGDGNSYTLSGVEVASNGTQKVYKYDLTYTYSNDGPYTAYYYDCCRISDSSNGADGNYYISCVVSLANNNLGSPVSTSPVLITMPQNSSNQFQLTATEPNNGNITFSAAAIQDIAYLPSATYSASVSPSGLLQWNTIGTYVGQEWFMKVVITGSDGISKTELDFLIEITNGGPQTPICLINGNSNNTVVSGTPFSISVSGTDPEGQTLTITNQNVPSGMTSSIVSNTITYNWIPTNAQIGTYSINTTFRDPTNLSTSCAYNVTVLEKKIISCYEFTGNTNDTKNINNGTPNGGSYTTDRFGSPNSAYLLNGTSNYISIPTTGLSNPSYSFSAWVKPYSLPASVNNPSIVMDLGNSGGDHAAGFFLANGLPSMGIISYGHTALTSPYTPINFQLGSLAPWKHVVYTLSGNTVKYYVDGNVVSTFTTTGSTYYASPVIGTIGARVNISQFFNGEIDDVILVKEALNDAEVLAIYQSSSGCPNIVNTPLISVKPLSGNIYIGTPFNVEALLSNYLANTGNTYVVQLSDINGSFGNNTIIGSSSSTIINCVLPANTPLSNNYKIRIVATDPVLTSINTQPLIITDKRLISCYSFSGNTNDGKGTNNGTANGGTYISNRAGLANSAYLLNGTSEYISIPTNDLNNVSYSFSAWVKPYSMPTLSGNPTRTMISLGNISGDQSMLFAYNSTAATSVLQVAASGVTATTPTYNVNITTGAAANWKHIVGTLKNNTLKYYIDGNLVQTTATTGTPLYNSPILGQIGRRISGSQYFHGEIDDVMLYKDELNDAEVLALYSTSTGCPTNIENTPLIVLKPLAALNVCRGTAFNVNFITGNFTANLGNLFKVELSEANGSFVNPTTIGTGSNTTISCTIPTSVNFGTGYKIRVVASNPSLLSFNEIFVNVNGTASATLSGGATIADGNSTIINLALTGSFPINYTLTDGITGVATTSPVIINVAPYNTTTYSITTMTNACGVGSYTGTATITVQPSKQLLVCYPFDNSVRDEIGGTLYSNTSSAVFTQDRKNRQNSALFFGINRQIDFLTYGLENPTYTMSAWVKPRFLPSVGEKQSILSLIGSGSEHNIGIINSSDTYDEPAWMFTSSGSYNTFKNTFAFGVDTTRWYHIAAVRTLDSLKLFIDGKQIIRTYSGGQAAFHGQSSNGTIGGLTYSSPATYFKGRIDEAKIFKGALSDAEIEELYHSDYCQYTVVTRQAELIACYPFNGNVVDTKNGYNGTVDGATLTTDRFGTANSAYSFDGNDRIQLPSTLDFQNRQFTVSAWFNSNTLPNSGIPQRPIISFGYNRVLQNIGSWVFYNSGNTGNSPFVSSVGLGLNQWYHIAAVIEGGNVKLYLNGEFQGGKLGTVTNVAFSGLNYIGYRDGTTSYFDGKIDDLKIFKGVLYDAEIKKLYQSELVAPPVCSFTPCVPTILKTTTDGLNADVSHQIVARNIIQQATNIKYEAGKSILLKPGFVANSQSVFIAQIGGCSN